VGDRAIPIARSALGLVDLFVDREFPAGDGAEALEQMVERVVTMLGVQHRGDRDRPGVDHRVERPVGEPVKLDRVEGVTARFDTDELEHFVRAEFIHRQAVGEWLRNRLDGERPVAVARLEYLTTGGRHTHAKFVGTGPAQFGNVGGYMPLLLFRCLS
jgi:hypothetical protein